MCVYDMCNSNHISINLIISNRMNKQDDWTKQLTPSDFSGLEEWSKELDKKESRMKKTETDKYFGDITHRAIIIDTEPTMTPRHFHKAVNEILDKEKLESIIINMHQHSINEKYKEAIECIKNNQKLINNLIYKSSHNNQFEENESIIKKSEL